MSNSASRNYGRRPDYHLQVKPKDGSTGTYSHRVGSAWKIEGHDGLTIRLAPGVELRWDDELHISLWPAEDPGERRPRPRAAQPHQEGERFVVPDDPEGDIPFE